MKPTFNMTLNRVQTRRIVYVVLVMVSVLATMFLLRVHSRQEASAYEATVRNAWQKETMPISGAMNLSAVRARFNIAGGGASGDLVWQVTSVDELRSSLLALDLAGIKLREVKLARRGSGFTISAEQTP